jgi:hypothetical protein
LTGATGPPEFRPALATPPAAQLQLPARVASNTQVASSAKPTNHRIDTGTPCTVGSPDGNFWIMLCAASQTNAGWNASPENRPGSSPPPAASPMPRNCVDPPVAHFSPTSDRPR